LLAVIGKISEKMYYGYCLLNDDYTTSPKKGDIKLMAVTASNINRVLKFSQWKIL